MSSCPRAPSTPICDDDPALFHHATNNAVSSSLPVASPSSSSPSSPPLKTVPRDKRVGVTSSASSGYTTANAPRQKLIVFSTPCRYQTFVWILLSIPPVAILIQIVLLHIDGSEGIDDGKDGISNSARAWILGWVFLLVVVAYMFTLPKHVDVRSNGTVGIKSFLLTYHIDDIVRAYQAGMGREDFLRPRFSFATRVSDGRVVIRRKNGKWDVVVSPSDPDGFIQAIEEVVGAANFGNEGNGGAMVSTSNGRTKADLASESSEIV